MICRNFETKEVLNIKTHCKIFPDISDRKFWEKAKKSKMQEHNAIRLQQEVNAIVEHNTAKQEEMKQICDLRAFRLCDWGVVASCIEDAEKANKYNKQRKYPLIQ